MERHHIQVTGIEMIKQGTNASGPWHLYKLQTPAKKYSTFLEGLQIGQEYDVLAENKPYRGKADNKMHDGWQITGFDNVPKKAEQTYTSTTFQEPLPQVIPATHIVKDQSFTEADRKMINDTYRDVQAIKIYLTGEAK